MCEKVAAITSHFEPAAFSAWGGAYNSVHDGGMALELSLDDQFGPLDRAVPTYSNTCFDSPYTSDSECCNHLLSSTHARMTPASPAFASADDELPAIFMPADTAAYSPTEAAWRGRQDIRGPTSLHSASDSHVILPRHNGALPDTCLAMLSALADSSDGSVSSSSSSSSNDSRSESNDSSRSSNVDDLGQTDDVRPQSSAGNGSVAPVSHRTLCASYDAQSDDDDDSSVSREHCTNCTGALIGDICMECGHLAEDDRELFSTVPVISSDCTDTLLIWDERMELHREAAKLSGSPHPERPDRLRAVMSRLTASGLASRCQRAEAREATQDEISACHTRQLHRLVRATSQPSTAGIVNFSPDTYTNADTFLCARLAAGASVDAAVAVASGRVRSAAAIVRPPGHHAESGMAMGFCFFNNAAIAARAARAAGAPRILIVDWDVHHGNGTQHILEEDPDIMYASLHRHDRGNFYPGTGAPSQVGRGAGVGATVNIAWDGSGVGDADYLAAFHHVILPIAHQFAPTVIIISAGFDAAAGDPIGGCQVTPNGFAAMTALLASVAPIALILEGGYNLSATASGVEASLRVCMGEQPPPLRPAGQAVPSPTAAGMAAIQQAIQIQAQHWSCLRGLLPAPQASPELPQPRVHTILSSRNNGRAPVFADEADADVLKRHAHNAENGGASGQPDGLSRSHAAGLNPPVEQPRQQVVCAVESPGTSPASSCVTSSSGGTSPRPPSHHEASTSRPLPSPNGHQSAGSKRKAASPPLGFGARPTSAPLQQQQQQQQQTCNMPPDPETGFELESCPSPNHRGQHSTPSPVADSRLPKAEPLSLAPSSSPAAASQAAVEDQVLPLRTHSYIRSSPQGLQHRSRTQSFTSSSSAPRCAEQRHVRSHQSHDMQPESFGRQRLVPGRSARRFKLMHTLHAANVKSAALQRCSSEKHAGIKSENSLTPREVPQTQLPQHAKDTEAEGPCHDLASDT